MILTIHKLYLSWSDATPRPKRTGTISVRSRMNGPTPQALHTESLAVAENLRHWLGGLKKYRCDGVLEYSRARNSVCYPKLATTEC